MTSKNKKGFSLVEVAIALAIITIVTVTALTIALNSITPQINNNNRAHAQNFAHNVWQCFQVANDYNDVFTLLSLSYDTTNMRKSEGTDGEGYTTYTYTSAEHNYTASIKLRFPDSTEPDGRPRMEITVKDGKDKEIIQLSYERGIASNAEENP